MDESARRFYERYGFESFPGDPLRLALLLKDVRTFVAPPLRRDAPEHWFSVPLHFTTPALDECFDTRQKRTASCTWALVLSCCSITRR